MDLWSVKHVYLSTGQAQAQTFQIAGSGEGFEAGGKSSGRMSFLRIGDRAAGAIKSGGTTRRAAKMVTVDIDHPDIEEYIDQVVEEQKVAALVAGSKLAQVHMNEVMRACVDAEGDDAQTATIKANKAL